MNLSNSVCITLFFYKSPWRGRSREKRAVCNYIKNLHEVDTYFALVYLDNRKLKIVHANNMSSMKPSILVNDFDHLLERRHLKLWSHGFILSYGVIHHKNLWCYSWPLV